jgi:hypothetical protein
MFLALCFYYSGFIRPVLGCSKYYPRSLPTRRILRTRTIRRRSGRVKLLRSEPLVRTRGQVDRHADRDAHRVMHVHTETCTSAHGIGHAPTRTGTHIQTHVQARTLCLRGSGTLRLLSCAIYSARTPTEALRSHASRPDEALCAAAVWRNGVKQVPG